MYTGSPTADSDTPATRLRAAVESAGFTIDGVPDDLSATQLGDLSQDLLRELSHVHAPDVAAALDSGDVQSAARLFMAQLEARA